MRGVTSGVHRHASRGDHDPSYRSADICHVTGHSSWRVLRGTAPTFAAVVLSLVAILGTATCLGLVYETLPDLLPVRFRWDGRAIGWQYRTWARVLMPAFVQVGLFAALGAVSALLLFRSGPEPHEEPPDVVAARTGAEAVMLMAVTWIGFQAYAAFALVRMWTTGGSRLGNGYTALEGVCILLTLAIGLRARTQLGRPDAPAYVAAHWRLGQQLYCNRDDPALFVPTRTGGRWTLNFGRPAAVILLGGILAFGLVAPTLLLALALR